MKMGNLALRRMQNKSQDGRYAVQTKSASYGGLILKTVLFAVATLLGAVAAYFGLLYALVGLTEELATVCIWVLGISFVATIVSSIIIAFAPKTVKVLGFVYGICQGILLGSVSLLADLYLQGIVFTAILGTIVLFFVAIVLNKLLQVKVSNRFLRGLLIAFTSIIIVSAVVGLLAAFGALPYNMYTLLMIGVSALCIIIATIMLMSDLQTADAMIAGGMDSGYEWNLAFSLVTSLTYIYVEILELLIRLVAIFGRKNS